MNQKATYEITITEKLRQLPVPDMRDAIWSRIEQQLDLDMPEDDDPNSPDTPDTGGWRKIGLKIGPFAVIVAVIAIFFINKNNSNQKNINDSQQPVKTETITPQTNDPTSPPTIQGRSGDSKTTPITNDGNTPVPASDSVFNEPPVIINNQPVADTLNKAPVFNPPVVQQSTPPPVKQDTIPKKPRGVKGIKDQDYHVTLKKDSVP